MYSQQRDTLPTAAAASTTHHQQIQDMYKQMCTAIDVVIYGLQDEKIVRSEKTLDYLVLQRFNTLINKLSPQTRKFYSHVLTLIDRDLQGYKLQSGWKSKWNYVTECAFLWIDEMDMITGDYSFASQQSAVPGFFYPDTMVHETMHPFINSHHSMIRPAPLPPHPHHRSALPVHTAHPYDHKYHHPIAHHPPMNTITPVHDNSLHTAAAERGVRHANTTNSMHTIHSNHSATTVRARATKTHLTKITQDDCNAMDDKMPSTTPAATESLDTCTVTVPSLSARTQSIQSNISNYPFQHKTTPEEEEWMMLQSIQYHISEYTKRLKDGTCTTTSAQQDTHFFLDLCQCEWDVFTAKKNIPPMVFNNATTFIKKWYLHLHKILARHGWDRGRAAFTGTMDRDHLVQDMMVCL